MNILKEKEISNVFNGMIYDLPRWQRRYEWIKPFWNNLWKSILVAYSTGGTSYTDVFVGTMLFQQKEPGEIKYSIIDGQQRLITITLILAAIRDLSNKSDLIEDINRIILVDYKLYKKEISNEKVEPSHIDQSCYHKIINGFPEYASKSDLIYRCYKFFIDEIKSSENLDLYHLLESIIKHLCVARVILNNNERAGEIFYELNYGGKELNDLDRIRVTFFADLDPALTNLYYNRYWIPIERKFYECPNYFDEYIKTIIGYQGIKWESNPPFKDFVNKLRELDIGERQEKVKRFLEDMDSQWESYLWIKEPEKIPPHFNEIKIRLIRLNIIDLSDAIPVLLHWVKLCKLTNTPTSEDKKTFIKILKIIETFYVRNLVCKEGNDIMGTFNNINKLMLSNGDIDVQLEKIKSLMKKSIPHDITFLKELEVSKLYKPNDNSISKLIIFALEYQINPINTIVWNPSSFSIEHIMPQILSVEWKEYLGDNWEVIQNDWGNTLGNLAVVPTEFNSKYSNKLYEDKMVHYKRYKYGVFNSINKNQCWREEEIKTRGSILAEECTKNIWVNIETKEKYPKDGTGFNEKPIFEPIIRGDLFKRVYYNKSPLETSKTNKMFVDLVKIIINAENAKFESFRRIAPLEFKELFSENQKRGFSIYIIEANIYTNSTGVEKNIAENCSKLKQLFEWTWENWYGEAERTENGEKRSVFFQ